MSGCNDQLVNIYRAKLFQTDCVFSDFASNTFENLTICSALDGKLLLYSPHPHPFQMWGAFAVAYALQVFLTFLKQNYISRLGFMCTKKL